MSMGDGSFPAASASRLIESFYERCAEESIASFGATKKAVRRVSSHRLARLEWLVDDSAAFPQDHVEHREAEEGERRRFGDRVGPVDLGRVVLEEGFIGEYAEELGEVVLLERVEFGEGLGEVGLDER